MRTRKIEAVKRITKYNFNQEVDLHVSKYFMYRHAQNLKYVDLKF